MKDIKRVSVEPFHHWLIFKIFVPPRRPDTMVESVGLATLWANVTFHIGLMHRWALSPPNELASFMSV